MPPAQRFGAWAAGSAAALSLAYIGAQLLEWIGAWGSAGGPNAASTPLGIALLLTPSLLLGPAFVATVAALHAAAPPSRKAVTLSALGFAAMYATLTGLVYFVQLTFVAPRIASGDTADIALLLFVPYRSFLFAIDLFGYSLMSLATLFAAFGVPRSAEAGAVRAALLANGALLPFIALQMFWPPLIWPAALWGATFPASMLLVVRMFRRLPSA